ncbi:hypothetical protein MUN84_05190 [Hymenobacter sp. 5516J-16]|uniref:hypothetical protein n=1 Tax=Hymenobacter sp. 5516J-16 TaxID=2932253 RepID=UPI001FD25341|nr:hypothetical protein [Hymenobacter sp. 5516J-16]UOQ78017.1 hypothetical protein MUN84_05190 [Hymenobacter sp. 5516J-16]
MPATSAFVKVLTYPTLAPVTLESNLHDMLGEQTGESLANFALGLADRNQQSMRLTLRLKPSSVTSAGRRISPSGDVTVDKDFTARQALNAVNRRNSLQQRP